ncbi:XRE family transcriptional regulator [Halomonas sp. JS92-SW72]|uniref:XRE family transcriptional regulator n=1 Tax=Halomonas sp. JS92-SW72 TaxID=2306583 RepID=UPI000E5A2884|nr:XRE family transcriptional regulator [Halomonas sp. JS92-SW72]AXY41632.1 helix-turn-helix transcriptional regulator [Halomonas sp. JS92-SW72]
METELDEKEPNPVPNPTDGIGTRIAEVADRLGGRKKAASAAGVSVSTLNRWTTGESVPVFAGVARLCMAAGVSLDWVAYGDDMARAMHRVYANASEELMCAQEASASSPESESAMADYALVPLYDAQCSAGDGAWNENCQVLTHLAFTRYSLRKQGLTPEHLSAIRVDGDSMEPVLEAGDTVLIDHTRTHIEGEGIYIIRLDHHLYAKRLQRSFDGVAIISENPAYREIQVPRDRLDELEIIGRAVWAAGWL